MHKSSVRFGFGKKFLVRSFPSLENALRCWLGYGLEYHGSGYGSVYVLLIYELQCKLGYRLSQSFNFEKLSTKSFKLVHHLYAFQSFLWGP